jgi:hypothetical protein
VLPLYRADALTFLLEQYKARMKALQEIQWTGEGIVENKELDNFL